MAVLVVAEKLVLLVFWCFVGFLVSLVFGLGFICVFGFSVCVPDAGGLDGIWRGSGAP